GIAPPGTRPLASPNWGRPRCACWLPPSKTLPGPEGRNPIRSGLGWPAAARARPRSAGRYGRDARKPGCWCRGRSSLALVLANPIPHAPATVEVEAGGEPARVRDQPQFSALGRVFSREFTPQSRLQHSLQGGAAVEGHPLRPPQQLALNLDRGLHAPSVP